MKEIQTVSIWYNGLMVAATIFNLIGQNDNLSTSASFTLTSLIKDGKTSAAISAKIHK